MIYIIIPVHNRIKLTINCLDSLQRQTYRNFTTIVVDDGSTDGTSNIIKEKFGNMVEVLKGDGSLWWSGATNLGVKHILHKAKDEDLILTLNNDLIVKENYLEMLVECRKKYPYSLIGSFILYKNTFNKVCYGGNKWNRITAKYSNNFRDGEIIDFKVVPEVMDTDMLPGRGTLIPIKVFKAIGFFDSFNFPQYAADEDFSLRAKKKGYNLLISTKALVFSEVQETGINFKYDRPSFFNFIKSLYFIKSANNLKVRFRFAKRHARYWIVYIIFDTARLIGSFVRSFLRYYLKKTLIMNV